MEKSAVSRRAVVAGIAGLAAYGLPSPAAAKYLNRASRRQDFSIRPRSDWASDERPARRALEAEDVKFLLVHHTLIPGNAYEQARVPQLLREIFDYHTGPDKGWADIEYNFVVDRFGEVWEGRSGSLAGPVRSDASGGDPGFSQTCCFLGDLSGQPPTPEAADAMTSLLATLAERYTIATEPGSTVSLTSRGSDRFPQGTSMELATISAHRDVSLTACPGDAGYAFVQNVIPALVNERRAAATTATTTSSTTAPAATTTAPTTSAGPTSTDEIDQTSGGPLAFEPEPPGDIGASESGTDDSNGRSLMPIAVGGGTLALAGFAAVAAAKRFSGRAGGAALPAPGKVVDQGTNLMVPSPKDAPAPAVLAGATAAGLSPHPGPGAVALERAEDPEPTKAPPIISAGPVPASGPQRVWWAVGPDTPATVESQIQDLVGRVHALASAKSKGLDEDRLDWAKVDAELAAVAGGAQAALVTARANGVFVFRSSPCLVTVVRPDGVIKKDRSRDALAIARPDVKSVMVHFGGETDYPDIEVTAN